MFLVDVEDGVGGAGEQWLWEGCLPWFPWGCYLIREYDINLDDNCTNNNRDEAVMCC